MRALNQAARVNRAWISTVMARPPNRYT